MNDLMKVKLLLSLDEDLKVEPHEFPCCILVGLLSLGWIDRNFRFDILFDQFPINFLLFRWINLGGYTSCGFY